MVGKYKLIDKLKDAFIVETEDEVFYDADISDDSTKNTFISNIEKQMKKEEIKILRSLNYTDADSFVDYLEKDPNGIALRERITRAAYCMKHGPFKTHVPPQLIYYNDCMDLHYEYVTDIVIS